MGKSKKKYDAMRALTVKVVAKDFEVTESYVRQCINNRNMNERAEEIYLAFHKKYEALSNAIS